MAFQSFENSNHLNIAYPNTQFILIQDSMAVSIQMVVTWLCRPFEYQTFWTINRLFQTGFQTTIWIPKHLTTGHKSTIWIPDYSGIQMETVSDFQSRLSDYCHSLSAVSVMQHWGSNTGSLIIRNVRLGSINKWRHAILIQNLPPPPPCQVKMGVLLTSLYILSQNPIPLHLTMWRHLQMLPGRTLSCAVFYNGRHLAKTWPNGVQITNWFSGQGLNNGLLIKGFQNICYSSVTYNL